MTSSDTARTLPVSSRAASTTLNVQSRRPARRAARRAAQPAASSPENGACAAAADENGAAAASSNTAWQRLLPPLPARSNSVAVAPPGAVSVPTRSPTNVWSSPTVVAPAVVVHGVAVDRDVSFDA